MIENVQKNAIIMNPLFDTFKDRQLIRLYIYNRIKGSEQFNTMIDKFRVTREVYENLERNCYFEGIDVTKEKLDEEIDRCLTDPSYLW